MKKFTKGPSERLDYTVDYTKELAKVEDTIASSLWVVPSATTDGSGNSSVALSDAVVPNYTTPTPTYSQGGTFFDNETATIFISGGTLTEIYVIENRITTTAGRKYTRQFSIEIIDKTT